MWTPDRAAMISISWMTSARGRACGTSMRMVLRTARCPVALHRTKVETLCSLSTSVSTSTHVLVHALKA